MLSDVCGFGVSIFAAWAVARRSHHAYSFGYHRVEIIGALVSIMLIWLVTGMLVYEAVNRLINPVPVDGKSKRHYSSHHNMAAVVLSMLLCAC
jgi:zinc transporter 2